MLGKGGFAATEPVLRHVLRTGRPHEEVVETGGSLFHVRRLPVRRGGETSHVVSWFEDIGARRQHELQLVAEDRVAFLSQLVSGVAHEISNPLAGIAGCAEALASLASRGSRDSRREARQFRDLIRTEVQRCERIVSSCSTRRARAGAERADVRDTLSSRCACSSATPRWRASRCAPGCRHGLPRARIDADALKQVVMALVMNAAAAMPDGGTLAVPPAAVAGCSTSTSPTPGRRSPSRSAPGSSSRSPPPMPSGGQASGSPSPEACSGAAGVISSTGHARTATCFRVVLRVATGTR